MVKPQKWFPFWLAESNEVLSAILIALTYGATAGAEVPLLNARGGRVRFSCDRCDWWGIRNGMNRFGIPLKEPPVGRFMDSLPIAPASFWVDEFSFFCLWLGNVHANGMSLLI